MYDFDKPVNRKNSDSYKWDYVNYKLPMWVADMDFSVAPCINKAILKRMECPVYGYSITNDDYYLAYINWFNRRHHILFKKEWMFFSTGVVPTISSTVRKLTNIGDNVLIQSPVYNIFYNSIINNGRVVLSSDLVYENGMYHIDFLDLENKMKDPKTTLMILCNPHNPIGKIWSLEELKKIASLAYKYNVIVLSDEIHCDITTPGLEYIPFISVSEEAKMNSVTAVSATKCFGVPGLQSSCVVIPNEDLRKKVNRQLNTDECAEGNVFAYLPIIAAFNEGEEWVNEMNAYVANNKKIFKELLSDTKLNIVNEGALYLLWIDISQYCNDSDIFRDSLAKNTGLYVSSGIEYGKNGKNFIRINLATTKENCILAAKMLKEELRRH